jgi:hypothetical protein
MNYVAEAPFLAGVGHLSVQHYKSYGLHTDFNIIGMRTKGFEYEKDNHHIEVQKTWITTSADPKEFRFNNNNFTSYLLLHISLYIIY